MELENTRFYDEIVELLKRARSGVKQLIDSTMAHTYFDIGRRIIEEEQNGKERADYGKEIIKKLSVRLGNEFGKGFSQRNLEQMRKFYRVYSKNKISQAVPAKFNTEKILQSRFIPSIYYNKPLKYHCSHSAAVMN